MSQVCDVLVVGGGLHGLSAALHCARRGAKVSLIEAAWLGRHASSATAAGVRTLGRDYHEMPISLESMQMWHSITDLVGDNCGFHADGQMTVAEDQAGIDHIRAREAQSKARGYQNERIIDQAELRALVPSLAHHCLAALYAQDDGAADPHRTIRAFSRACRAAGVSLHEHTRLTSLKQQGSDWLAQTSQGDFSAARVINCAGAWGAGLAAMVGETIPLGHKASMMIVTEKLQPFLKQVVGGYQRSLSFKQSAQGTLVIGGGLQGRADVQGERSWVDYKVLARSAQSATQLFPAVGEVRITRCWTGIEAKTDDLLPVIDQSEAGQGLWHAFGFSGHGFQLVPVVGSIMADLALEGQTHRHIAPFVSARLKKDRNAS